MDYRQRFGLTHHVFPQDACGDTFFETPSYKKLQRSFAMLHREPGLGVVIGDVGVGKTSAIRNLCKTLPRPDYQVIYLCDTAVAPLDLYRQLAVEIGVTPSHRRAQLWQDLKATLLTLVDEKGIQPTLVVDEAQHLSDRFLLDLSGFLNFAMDSRNLLVLWLVGQPSLRALLRMNCHAALASRIVARVQLEPLSDRKLFLEFLAHGFKAAGAKSNLLADNAVELLFRASHGVPRRAAGLLRDALTLAHEQNKAFIDDTLMEAVLDDGQDF